MKEKPYAEFPYSEYKRRNEKAKELMEKYGIDGLMLFTWENCTYYTGFRCTWHFNYFRGAVVPRDGEPAYVAPGEIDRLIPVFGWVENVKRWEEHPYPPPEKSPVKVMADTIKEYGLANKVIGVELGIGMYWDGVTYNEFEAIKRALPDAKFVDATDMVWEQRKIKTPWEIQTIRKLGDATAKAFKTGLEFTREGVSEREIQDVMWKTVIKEGLADAPMKGGFLMRSGPAGGLRINMPTSRAVDYRLRKGDQLMIDAGPTYKGYHSDIQRQAVIGEPSELIKKHFKQAMVGYEAAMKIMKPGTKVADLYKVPMKAMSKFNPEAVNPYTHMGHGIGLRIHEPPCLTEDAPGMLEPGMVITVETAGYKFRGDARTGWKIDVMGGYPEDMFLITEDGYENLTRACPVELWVR